jgi:hypothetical protein
MANMNKSKQIEPFIPWYCRAPNKLVRYEDRPFEDCIGNQAMVTVAIFTDKSGKELEADAHIKWTLRK